MKGNRKLEVFKKEYLLNKEEVLRSLELYIEHCIKSEEEEWDEPQREARVRLCREFQGVIEAMLDFSVKKDWQYYEYSIYGSGIKLELLQCDEIKISPNEEIEAMSASFLQDIVDVPCRFLSVNEFARRYEVTDTTVRQWIRRGKIRHAKKTGRDWVIPELTARPERGYEPAVFFWEGRLEGQEFARLSGYQRLSIFQDEEHKKQFVGILQGAGNEKERIDFTIEERERLELALIAHDKVRVEEFRDNIMYIPPKQEMAAAWEQELEIKASKKPIPQAYVSYGPVVVTKGCHKGRIGYLDDEQGQSGIVYWGDMLLGAESYAMIRLSYLSNDISTHQMAERVAALREKIYTMRSRRTNYYMITQLMGELLFVENMLMTRYYETLFLKPEQGFEIFLSYAREDRAIARYLATDLREKGYNVFLDDWSIEVGDHIWEKIRKALVRADMFIPIVSKAFLESPYCRDEWNAFYMENKDKGKSILPLVIDDSEVPPVLKGYKYYRWHDWRSDYEELLTALLKKLKTEEKAKGGTADA